MPQKQPAGSYRGYNSKAAANNLSKGVSMPAVFPLQGIFASTKEVIQRNPAEILKSTKETLSHGRGNVWKDIKENNGASYKRTLGGMSIASNRGYRSDSRTAFNDAPRNLQQRLKDVLPFIIMGAGNCMEHAVVAMFQTNFKYPGKHIWLMSWAGGDHQFLLIADVNDIERATVVDAWDPSENNKPYRDCEWYNPKNVAESPGHIVADGKDYITAALANINDKEELVQSGIEAGEYKSRGVDFSSYQGLSGSSPEFKIYNF